MLAKDKMIFLLILCLTGAGLGLDVRQSASDIFTKPGDKVQIFCSHDKTDFYQMLWYQRSPGETAMKLIGHVYHNSPTMEDQYKDNFNIAGELSGNKKKNSSLNIQVAGSEQGAVYYCAASDRNNNPAYFGKGTKLTVLETELPVTPPKIKILPPSPNECRNQKDKKRKKTLVCVASGFYPDHVQVSWEINGKVQNDGVATDSAAKRDGVGQLYRITSRLRVPADTYNTVSNKFTCIVKFFNGEKTKPYEKSINGIQGKAEKGMTRERYLKLTQNAKLSYIVVIAKSCFYGVFIGVVVWKLQGSARKHH